MRLSSLISTMVLAVCTASSAAQAASVPRNVHPPQVVPAARTTPPAATADDPEEYEKILSDAYAADGPGTAALVAQGGEIVYLGAVGMADLELGVPLEPDMVFEIGSITKQFTAAGIMLLAEEGKLELSDPITRHLPDYPDVGDDVSIEHLLSHTSGIVSYTGIPGYMASEVRNDVTVAELIDVFKDLPAEFAPGDRYAYNNSGYILLGAIIEAASGMTYDEFVRTRFFEPLGMNDAHYGCNGCIIPRRASGYDSGPEGYRNQRYLSFSQPYAAGSLMMTVEDLHRWTRALFGGAVVSAESVERMTTPFSLNDGTSTDYGYGFAIGKLRGRRVNRHGGGIFGFVTEALYVPEMDVFTTVFSNNATGEVNPATVNSRLAALAIGDPFPDFEEVAVAEDVLRRYVGVYEIDADAQRTVTFRDGAVYTQRTGGPERRAYPSSETSFFYEGSLTHLEFVVEDGEVTGMFLYPDGDDEGEWAAKVSDEVPTPETITLPPEALERLVGVYELRPEFEITISLDGEQLMAQATGQGSSPIHPTSETEFIVEAIDTRITFQIGADGRASALTLHQGGQELEATRK